MSPTTLTYNTVTYGDQVISPEQVSGPLLIAYQNGLGDRVRDRFKDLIRDGIDASIVFQGLSSALTILGNDLGIADNERHQAEIVEVMEMATERYQADGIGEHANPKRIFHGLLSSVIAVDRLTQSDDPSRDRLIERMSGLMVFLAKKYPESEHNINGIGLDEELLAVDWITPTAGAIVGQPTRKMDERESGHKDGTMDELDNDENIPTDAEISSIIDLSILDGATDIGELVTAYETHPDSGSRLLDIAFNRRVDRKILDPDVSFVDSKYLLAHRQDTDDYERLNQLRRVVDCKMLIFGELLFKDEEYELVLVLLEKQRLRTNPEDEMFDQILLDASELRERAERAFWENICVGDIENTEDPTDFDIVADGYDGAMPSDFEKVKETRAIKLWQRLEKVELNEEGVVQLDESHPLRLIFTEAKKSDPTNIKVAFIEKVLNQLSSAKDIRLASKLVELRHYVDDQQLVDALVDNHDRKLLMKVKHLFYTRKRYRDVLVLLTTVRFVGPDEDDIVKEAKSIFDDAQSVFNEQLKSPGKYFEVEE